MIFLGIKIRSGDYSSWYNSSVEKLESFLEDIVYLSDQIASRMVFGCSFSVSGNFVTNTEGTLIYRGRTYRIPTQTLAKPKNGEYIYISDYMVGTLAISSTKRDIAVARYSGGQFDYSVRDYRFSTTTTEEPVEGMMIFDQEKSCFAAYHSDEWLYERRSSLIFSYNYDQTFEAGIIGSFGSSLPNGTNRIVLCAGFYSDTPTSLNITMTRDGSELLTSPVVVDGDNYVCGSCLITSGYWSIFEITVDQPITITSLSVSAIIGE